MYHTCPNPRNNKTIVVEFLHTRNTSLNLTLRYNQYLVVHEFTSVHFFTTSYKKHRISFYLHHTHILYDFNNIQQILPLRGNSFKEEVHPKPILGMF